MENVMGNKKRVMIEPGLHVELALSPFGFVSSWEPGIPRQITEWQLKRYLFERDKYLKDLSIDIDGIMLFDWEGVHRFSRGEKLTVSRKLGS
jgi:hypothetical protein